MNRAELTHMIIMGQDVWTDGEFVGTEEQWDSVEDQMSNESLWCALKLRRANAVDVIQLELLEDDDVASQRIKATENGSD